MCTKWVVWTEARVEAGVEARVEVRVETRVEARVAQNEFAKWVKGVVLVRMCRNREGNVRAEVKVSQVASLSML